jgi:hypothetical protein
MYYVFQPRIGNISVVCPVLCMSARRSLAGDPKLWELDCTSQICVRVLFAECDFVKQIIICKSIRMIYISYTGTNVHPGGNNG